MGHTLIFLPSLTVNFSFVSPAKHDWMTGERWNFTRDGTSYRFKLDQVMLRNISYGHDLSLQIFIVGMIIIINRINQTLLSFSVTFALTSSDADAKVLYKRGSMLDWEDIDLT